VLHFREILQRDVLDVTVDPLRHLLFFPQGLLQRPGQVDAGLLAQGEQRLYAAIS
jgi:hypothetical protein